MRRLILLLAAALLGACDAESLYDTEYFVYFEFDTKLHVSSLITHLYQNSNCFLTVSATANGNVRTLTIDSNGGEHEVLTVATEREVRMMRGMGADNSLIMGCVFDFDGYAYVAYDRQCPACLKNYSTTRFPLQWGSKANTVTCTNCERTYHLLSSGSGDGYRLKTYRMRYDTATQKFLITNK